MATLTNRSIVRKAKKGNIATKLKKKKNYIGGKKIGKEILGKESDERNEKTLKRKSKD